MRTTSTTSYLYWLVVKNDTFDYGPPAHTVLDTVIHAPSKCVHCRPRVLYFHSRTHAVTKCVRCRPRVLYCYSRTHAVIQILDATADTAEQGEKPGGIFTSLTQLMSKCRIELYVLSVLLHRSPCTAHQSNKTARFFIIHPLISTPSPHMSFS
jgi:hypothetical protein